MNKEHQHRLPQYQPAQELYEPAAPAVEIHLMDYIQIILQRLPLAISIGLAVVVLGTIYTWTRPPRFTAKASLLMEPGKVNLTDIKDAIDPVSASLGKREFIQTQVELIKSRPVAEMVIQRMNLLEKDEFRNAKDPVARFQSLIKASPERNTNLITVSIERHDKAEAQQMVNALISAFIDDVRSRRLGVSEDGLDQLRQKEKTMREKLDAATDALQDFMIANNMVSFEKTQNVVMNRLMDLSRELNALQPKRMQLQAKVEAATAAIEKGESITVLPDVIDAPIIHTLKLELAKLSNEYSQLVERLGENHPNLQSKTTQIQSLQTKMTMEADSILKSIHMQYEQAMAEEALLANAMKEQEQEVYRFNRLATEYDNLKRIRDSIEAPYTTISRRIEEIDINRIGGQGENIFIIAKAALPVSPSWPNKKKNMMLIIVLAGALSVGICFFLDYMDTTIKGESDVRRLLGSKVLAGIPNVNQKGEFTSSADLITFENPRSHTAEAFRTLRTALAFSVPGERIGSVVISSTLPSEGKSLSAISIAITHAQTGKRTLLVDADMRKPRLHSIFGMKTGTGLSRLLGDPATTVEMVAQKTDIPNLDFIPCGPIPRNPAELLDSARFEKTIATLRETYDFIVFDSPPGFSLVDSLVIAKHTDGLILIIKSFQTPKAAAEQFATRLYEANVRLLGVVLNTMDAPRSGYYGGYYQAGGRRYAKYYREEDTGAA
jgi:capsular exopolysaccharide synthesis family protein